MLVTSTSPVFAPALFDFDMPLLQDAKNLRDFPLRNSVILRHFDARLKPDLEFAGWRLDVHVQPIFFAGVEVEPVGSFAKHRRTHANDVTTRAIALHGG
jgi:hypothetical protein